MIKVEKSSDKYATCLSCNSNDILFISVYRRNMNTSNGSSLYLCKKCLVEINKQYGEVNGKIKNKI